MSQQLDAIDTIATKACEGYVVRKDLVRKFKGQYPVPTYVAEFLLGRYCASVDDEEIAEGLKIVERQLGEKTVRAGEHELFKARAKDKGHIKHRQDGARYVYLPCVSRETASKSALKRLVATFFQGSATQAMAALLEAHDTKLSDTELNQLQQLIKQAKKEGR